MQSEEDFKKTLNELLEKTKNEQFECYPAAIKKEIKDYHHHETPMFLADIITDKFIEKKDADKFLSSFYGKIVLNASSYFQIERPACTLLAKTLGDKLLCRFSSNAKQTIGNLSMKPISEREISGLQYLAGYIVRKFTILAKKNKNREEGDAELSILRNATGSDINQEFVHAINRGGLTVVKEEWVKVFIVAEEVFRAETLLPSKKIDVEKIIKSISTQRAICFYNSIIDTGKSEKLRHRIFIKMLTLYIRVRAFSKARDLVNEHKKGKQVIFKEKTLRKRLAQTNPES